MGGLFAQTMAGNEMVFLIWIVVGPVVGYLIGKPKGHGGTGVVLGLFLSILGWIIVAVLPPARGFSSSGPVGPTRTCPHCAEDIKAAASVCRYCGREVEPDSAATAVPKGWQLTEMAYSEMRAQHPGVVGQLAAASERAGNPWMTERDLKLAVTDMVVRNDSAERAIAHRHS